MAKLNIVHCSYHKCLTVYYRRVLHAVFNRCLPWSGGYHHYNSHLDDFYDSFGGYRVASINNRALDLGRLGVFRLSRFVRDPRDLVVSGYLYHKRGAEPWVTMKAPAAEDWYFANGVIPKGMQGRDCSFAEYLQSLTQEDGLLAELEFRRLHFESMAQWPDRHPHVVTYRYESIIGHETRVFDELFDFYGLSWSERRLGHWFSRRYALGSLPSDAHVRNPEPGQWRQFFTPRVHQVFDAEYGSLIRMLGYPAD